MSALSKAEIGRAVIAIRELSDIIERLEKATWPLSSQSDVLRKSDLIDASPRASGDDIAKRALDHIADLNARIDALAGGV